MIERYSRPEMSHLWSYEVQLETWLKVEILACEAWSTLGRIPQKSLETIRSKAAFTPEKVLEREKVTRHDLAAFVSVVQDAIGPDGRFVHVGLTSSDIVDTAFAYRLKQSGERLLKGIEKLEQLTAQRALRDKLVPMIGRTHGIHAEPITMGLKWLQWHDAFRRAKERFHQALEEVSVGKLSGAVGTYTHAPPEVEAYVCKKLGLKVDRISTQVIARDRFASYFTTVALLGSVIECVATELRHLQRTEVGEVMEGFRGGQKGSSAMPHKRNPISAENLTGIARLLRGYAVPALESCALWHERDISHSSVERVIAPDANILADYALDRLLTLLDGLEIRAERMESNLDLLRGAIYSQRILLALVDRGLSRDEAYEIVQKNALAALDTGQPLKDLLNRDSRVAKILPAKELDVLMELSNNFRHLDAIYQKVLGTT